MKASTTIARSVSLAILASIGTHAATTDQNSTMLQEITVTAQLRKQNLQQVPIAVTPLSGAEAQARGIHDLDSLAQFVPGLTMSPFAIGQSVISLRGISNNDDGPGTDASVAVFVDGVYFGTVSNIEQQLFDLSQIEVLRGPQGTLYGKNAIGGVINITTTRPAMDGLHVHTRVTVGNYGRHDFSGLITGPLGDGWAGKLVVSTRKANGWVNNVVLHTTEKNDNTKSVRAQLLHEGEHTEWLLSANGSYINDEDMARIPLTHETLFPLPLLQTYQSFCGTAPNPSCATNPYDGYQRQTSYGTSAKFTDHLNSNTDLISITAWQRTYNQWSMDSLGAVLPLGSDVFDNDKELTEELRLVSSPTATLHYVAGIWLSREDRDRTRLFLLPSINAQLGITPAQDEHYTGVDRIISKAIYGQLDWRFEPRWTLSLGGRYSYDHKTMDNYSFGDVPTASGYGGAVGLGILPNSLINRVADGWGRFTPKVSLSFTPTEGVNLYVTESEGFQSGGFAASPTSIVDTRPLQPEIAYNTEFGAKMEFAHRLRANVALFDTNYKNLQIQAFGPRPGIVNPPPNYIGEFETFNAGSARAKGVELELDWLATDRLDFSATYGYMDAKLTNVYVPNGSIYSLLGGPGPSACLANPAQTGCLDLRNQSGQDMFRAPKNKGSFEARYKLPLSGHGHLETVADYSYTGSQRGELEPYAIQPSFGLFDARMTWVSPTDEFEVSLWGRNLANKAWLAHVYTIANEAFGVYGDPRMYGLSFDWKLRP